MPLGKLEFEKTTMLGDQAGYDTELPNPDDTPFASPDIEGDVAEFVEAENSGGDEKPAEPIDYSINPSDLKPKETPKPKPKSPWASGDDDPIGGEKPAEPGSEGGEPDGDFPQDLLEQATQYGYTAEDAKRFGSAENLRWAMADADRRAAEWGNQQLAALFQQQQAAQPQAPATPTPPVQPAPPQAQTLPNPDARFELNDEQLRQQGFDDDTIAIFRGIQSEYRNQIDALNQKIESANKQITGQSEADAQARFVQDMDAFFDGLGPEWEAEFGKGEMQSLTPDSPQWQNRRKVASTIFGLQVSDAQSNRRPAQTKEVAQRALASLYYKKLQEIAGKNAARASSERLSQATARSTGGAKQPISGFDKAVRRAVAFANKHKLNT